MTAIYFGDSSHEADARHLAYMLTTAGPHPVHCYWTGMCWQVTDKQPDLPYAYEAFTSKVHHHFCPICDTFTEAANADCQSADDHETLDPCLDCMADHLKACAAEAGPESETCPDGTPHEVDWSTVTLCYDGEPYLDVTCGKCGRGGSLGSVKALTDNLSW